jgi:hypothetical protein
MSGAWWTELPWNLAFIVGMALASYLLLERPLLAWRARLRGKVESLARPPRAASPAMIRPEPSPQSREIGPPEAAACPTGPVL